jgi:competence protein ComEA
MRLLPRLIVIASFSSLAWAGAPRQVARPAVAHPTVAAHASEILVDINTATAAELGAIPGMGSAYVRRIISGRPYTAKNQLVTRGVLPQAVYEKIQFRIIARRSTK